MTQVPATGPGDGGGAGGNDDRRGPRGPRQNREDEFDLREDVIVPRAKNRAVNLAVNRAVNRAVNLAEAGYPATGRVNRKVAAEVWHEAVADLAAQGFERPRARSPRPSTASGTRHGGR